MISNNNKCAAFVCLLGLAFLVASQAAELPPSSPKEEPARASQTQPATQTPAQSPADIEEDSTENMVEDDEDLEEEGYDEEDWDDEFDDEEEGADDEESGPEEELAWLAQQHYIIRTDCADLNETIAESNLSKVDPELKEAYQNCTSELKDIQTAIREMVDLLIGSQ